MTKTIDTLIDDIEELFQKEHKVNPDNLDALLKDIANVITEYVEAPGQKREFTLRLSKIGTPLRKMWYESREPYDEREVLDYHSLMRFFLGSLMEAVLIFLAKEAGHRVECEQKEVEIDGVPGHMDIVLDGHVTDIKTASGYSYRSKFQQKGLLNGDDPYGYIAQLSSYYKAENPDGRPAYFWAMNKENGDMTLLPLSSFDMIDPQERVKIIREMLAEDTPPEEKCYEPKPYGSSGNKVLDMNCVWCPFKMECWKDANGGKGLQVYRYAKKDEFFTEMRSEPRVDNVTKEYISQNGQTEETQ